MSERTIQLISWGPSVLMSCERTGRSNKIRTIPLLDGAAFLRHQRWHLTRIALWSVLEISLTCDCPSANSGQLQRDRRLSVVLRRVLKRGQMTQYCRQDVWGKQ